MILREKSLQRNVIKRQEPEENDMKGEESAEKCYKETRA
jgi:hypothetical protein